MEKGSKDDEDVENLRKIIQDKKEQEFLLPGEIGPTGQSGLEKGIPETWKDHIENSKWKVKVKSEMKN